MKSIKESIDDNNEEIADKMMVNLITITTMIKLISLVITMADCKDDSMNNKNYK